MLTLRLAGLVAAVLLVLLSLGRFAAAGVLTTAFFVLLAVGVRRTRVAGFAFTIWGAAFVSAAMFNPSAFRTWFGYELSGLIVPLIQIIMFGMAGLIVNWARQRLVRTSGSPKESARRRTSRRRRSTEPLRAGRTSGLRVEPLLWINSARRLPGPSAWSVRV